MAGAKKQTPKAAPAHDTLLGSSVLPAVVEIGELKVQLGGLVLAACRMSLRTTDEWNALSEPDREAELAKAIEALSADPELAKAQIDPASIVPDVVDAPSVDDLLYRDTPQPAHLGELVVFRSTQADLTGLNKVGEEVVAVVARPLGSTQADLTIFRAGGAPPIGLHAVPYDPRGPASPLPASWRRGSDRDPD